MTGRAVETSPQVYARIAGVCYLLEGLTAVFGQFIILGKLVVPGDAEATAASILANEPLYRLGFASCLMAVGFHIPWALLFYELLKTVNRIVSLLATFVILVGCALQALAALFYLAPLLVLEGENSVSGFTAEQLRALALVFLKLNGQTFNIYMVFFGFWCVLIGYLIFKSTFLPRIIGLLMMFGGSGYLTLMSAPLASYLYPFNMAIAGPGEISLLLWLLVKGVNVRRWKERASVWQSC